MSSAAWAKIQRGIGNLALGVFVGAIGLVVLAGVLYFNVLSPMADYDAYVGCNPGTAISRLEWLLGARPLEDCRR